MKILQNTKIEPNGCSGQPDLDKHTEQHRIVGSEVAQAAAKEATVPGNGPLENRGEPVSNQGDLNGEQKANYGSINDKQESDETK
jgi:hypothetical protein